MIQPYSFALESHRRKHMPTPPPSTQPFWFEEKLTGYIPRYQLRHVFEGLGARSEPTCETRAGAILLVDVSGFTALTERFAALGGIGAERLSGILNRYFGRVTDLITAVGGDIIAFAGDSALAMWLGEETNRSSSILCACQAAIDIQSELDHFEAGPDNMLRQRIGIGFGDLQLMELGGSGGRWLFVVVGEPIAEASFANHEASTGEIVLSGNAVSLLADRATGVSLPSGSLKLTGMLAQTSPPLLSEEMIVNRAPKTISALAGCVPLVVSARVRAGQEQWIAEFRTLSMLFLNLVDVDVRGMTKPDQLHRRLRRIQEILQTFEGTLYQCLMDDKGLTVVCAFGLPPLAHEDDPRRAVEAALTISEDPAQEGGTLSAGISTGTVFCGVYGSARRCQYTTLGNTMNLAARLMQAADHGVLCDEPTSRAVLSGSLQFESKGKISVKGRSASIEVFQPLRRADVVATSINSASAAIIGRKDECATFRTLLDDLIEMGKSACLIVEGEEGIGKTRLLEHLAQQTTGTGQRINEPIICWRGGGDSIHQSTSYHAWQPIFYEALDVGRKAENLRREQILSQLSTEPELLPLTPLLNPVLALDFPQTPESSALEGQARAENTQRLLTSLLRLAAGKRALVLLLDDAHWFDSASWRLVLSATQQIQPLLLVLSTRAQIDPPMELTELTAKSATKSLGLGPLEAESGLQIVCQRLGVKRLPPEVARLITDRAKGHPLFSEQLGYALRDAGLIQISEGRCQIPESASGAAFDAALSALRFPSTVEGVITSRLDRLAPDLQLTLKVASIFGQSFSSRALREVHPVVTDHLKVDAHLEEAKRLDLVRPLDQGGKSFAFCQAITQEVAYNSVPFAQRRQVHRAIGEWLEHTFEADLPAQYPLLAYHWRSAEAPEKAIHYCSEAGSQALRNHANQEAVRFFSDALQIDKEHHGDSHQPSRRAEWELQLGKAYVNWSKYVEGGTHLKNGLRLLGHRVPTAKGGAAFGLLEEAVEQSVHRLWSTHYLGLRKAERESLLRASRDFEGLTEVYFLQNKSLQCLHAVFRSLNLAELAGPSAELARGYSSVGNLLGFMTLHRAANRYFERAETIITQIDDPSAHAWVLVARAGYMVGIGRWDEAATLLQGAALTSDRLGNRRRGDDARIALLLVYLLQGKFPESLVLANSLYDSARERLDIRIQGEALYGKTWSLLSLNRIEDLPGCLEELESLSTVQAKIGGRHQKQYVDAMWAVVHLLRNDLPAARQRVDHAIEGAGNPFPNDLLVHTAITEVCLSLWQKARTSMEVASLPGFSPDGLQRVTRKSIQALQRYSRIFPIGKPMLGLRQGEYEWLLGKPAAAQQSWQLGLEAATKLQATYYEGLARLELAIHSNSLDAGSFSHRNSARETLTALGAARDLTRLHSAPDVAGPVQRTGNH